jgi:lycopene cyclase domain-containing protein
MKFEYFIVLFFVFTVPFIKSFSNAIGFYKNRLRLLLSIGFPFIVFVLWDIYSVSQGHWSFNSAYVIGLNIINLPIEEVLFFLVIPFCALFTWESVKYYIYRKR